MIILYFIITAEDILCKSIEEKIPNDCFVIIFDTKTQILFVSLFTNKRETIFDTNLIPDESIVLSKLT